MNAPEMTTPMMPIAIWNQRLIESCMSTSRWHLTLEFSGARSASAGMSG
jgi:hypothetical protein